MNDILKQRSLIDILNKDSGIPPQELDYVGRIAKRLADQLISDFKTGVPLEKAQKHLYHSLRKAAKLTNKKTMQKIIDRTNALIRKGGNL